MSAHRVLWFPPGRPVEGNTVYVRSDVCPVPSRWVLDELARELAERELVAAREACESLSARPAWGESAEVLDRYMVALEARNALRDGRP